MFWIVTGLNAGNTHVNRQQCLSGVLSVHE